MEYQSTFFSLCSLFSPFLPILEQLLQGNVRIVIYFKKAKYSGRSIYFLLYFLVCNRFWRN